MKPVERSILAIDPGLRELGYSLLRGPKLLDYGVLSLRKVPPHLRWAEIRRRLEAWTRGYQPGTLVLESTPRHQSGRLRSVYLLGRKLERLGTRRGLTVAAYSPKTVRKALLGNGWAGKREAAEAVCARYPALRVHLTHDRKWKEGYWGNMYDAVALALHHQSLTKPLSRSRSSG